LERLLLSLPDATLTDARLFIAGVATGLATLAGGVLAIRFRSQLNALAALGAGAVIAVALVDLLPEAVTLSRTIYPPSGVMLLTLLGFISYLVLDRLKGLAGNITLATTLGPASLVVHSVMDGIGIGLAFSVSTSVGLTIAAAVMAHDLLDGSNTVTLSVSGRPSIRRAWAWLVLDALAPLAGIALSRLMAPPATLLPLVLAFFAGIFLFIGAGELLPRSRTEGSGWATAILTALGSGLVAALALLGAG
jgi:zinc transporter ZupT